jgi:hypothetical protein
MEKVPLVDTADPAPNKNEFAVISILALDDETLEVTPLIVTAELLPNLIALSLRNPVLPPLPEYTIGPFLERM